MCSTDGPEVSLGHGYREEGLVGSSVLLVYGDGVDDRELEPF
jgi:hypothetical protein